MISEPQPKAWELQASNSHKKRKFKPRVVSHNNNNHTREEMQDRGEQDNGEKDRVEQDRMEKDRVEKDTMDEVAVEENESSSDLQRILPRYYNTKKETS